MTQRSETSTPNSETGSFHIKDEERYKTEMCWNIIESGLCKYGTKCQFAHSPVELRSKIYETNYKSKYCRKFHSEDGYCEYGSRCHFKHLEDDQQQINWICAPHDQHQQQQQQQIPVVGTCCDMFMRLPQRRLPIFAEITKCN